jgi:hypothetical protein
MKQRRRAGSLPASAPRKTAARRALLPQLARARSQAFVRPPRGGGAVACRGAPLPLVRRALTQRPAAAGPQRPHAAGDRGPSVVPRKARQEAGAPRHAVRCAGGAPSRSQVFRRRCGARARAGGPAPGRASPCGPIKDRTVPPGIQSRTQGPSRMPRAQERATLPMTTMATGSAKATPAPASIHHPPGPAPPASNGAAGAGVGGSDRSSAFSPV